MLIATMFVFSSVFPISSNWISIVTSRKCEWKKKRICANSAASYFVLKLLWYFRYIEIYVQMSHEIGIKYQQKKKPISLCGMIDHESLHVYSTYFIVAILFRMFFCIISSQHSNVYSPRATFWLHRSHFFLPLLLCHGIKAFFSLFTFECLLRCISINSK